MIPQQLIVYAPKGANNAVELPFGTSLYDLRQRQMPPEADFCEKDGLRLFKPEAALVKSRKASLPATRWKIAASALAGYRGSAVFLRGSGHVPPRWETVRDAMPAFFELLENETEPSARAVLGHWLFGYIHPYPDGNGRMARFLMKDRDDYLAALDAASTRMEIEPFAAFVAKRVQRSLA